MPKVPFPEVPVAELTVFRPFTAPGLFAYRHVQADGLMHFPDFSAGDFTNEQRREALDRALEVHRPLAALVVFLGVVALEDFFRDLGARLADLEGISAFFPAISKLRLITRPADADRPFAPLDKDPIQFLDFGRVNQLYLDCLSIEPIPRSEFPRLYDLSIVRHTVAHHGAIFRAIDADRFQHYQVSPGRLINPPVDFVKETCSYLYGIGRGFERSIQNRVFSTVLPSLDPGWPTSRPKVLIDLIELFNYLGRIVTSSAGVPPPKSLEDYWRLRQVESDRVKAELIDLCIAELASVLPPPTAQA